MTIYKAADLDLTNTPALEPREWSRIGDVEPSHPPAPLHRLLTRRGQLATERLAKVKTAVTFIRSSIDPAWVAVALLMAVMCGGFTWLSTKLNRVEAKLDAASLKVSEMPGTLQRDLQAQTERVAALINAQRQSGSAAPPGGGVVLTQDAVPVPSNARPGTKVAQIVNNAPPPITARESRGSVNSGAGSGGKKGTVASTTEKTTTRPRP